MSFKDLVLKTRSYRRFDGSHVVKSEDLVELVELARCSASTANLQPLKYVLSCSAETNAEIFETLGWAADLKDWSGPSISERPTAYVVILVDRNIRASAEVDVGIAAQSIMLGASERGLGGCMLGSAHQGRLKGSLEIPDHLDVALVLALGRPVERVVLEDVSPDGSVRYYRDADGVHHVPKRPITELVQSTF